MDMAKVKVSFKNLVKVRLEMWFGGHVPMYQTDTLPPQFSLNANKLHSFNKVLPIGIPNHTVTESSMCRTISG